MRHTLKSLLAFAVVSIAAVSGAEALPVIDKGDLNRHLVAKYQPRCIQAMADPYTPAISGRLRCRLTSIYGFTNENQSNGEVCQRLTGNPNWSNAGNRVRCNGASTVSTPNPNRVIRFNAPNQRIFRPCARWVWNGRAFVCR